MTRNKWNFCQRDLDDAVGKVDLGSDELEPPGWNGLTDRTILESDNSLRSRHEGY
jgi:hypothetical protein